MGRRGASHTAARSSFPCGQSVRTASHPKNAVALVAPNHQNFVDTGAGVARPVTKQMLEAAPSRTCG